MSYTLLNQDTSSIKSLIQRSVFPTVAQSIQSIRIGGIPVSAAETVSHLVPSEPTAAAVLLPIIDRPEGLSLLFTERSPKLKSHAGQISFPGGRIEVNDGEPKLTALRETEEEIGLSRDYVEIMGYLTPHVVFSGFSVTPVIGWVSNAFTLNVDATEVESVFEVPLSFFMNSQNHHLERRQLGDISVPVYYFEYAQRRIWGMTAGIIMHLYERMTHEFIKP